jgi:hypothetical protein
MPKPITKRATSADTREIFRQFIFSAPARTVPDEHWPSAVKCLSPRPVSPIRQQQMAADAAAAAASASSQRGDQQRGLARQRNARRSPPRKPNTQLPYVPTPGGPSGGMSPHVRSIDLVVDHRQDGSGAAGGVTATTSRLLLRSAGGGRSSAVVHVSRRSSAATRPVSPRVPRATMIGGFAAALPTTQADVYEMYRRSYV